MSAIPPHAVESFRALLPVGYEEGARAYRVAAASVDARSLTDHYTKGLDFFHEEFVPYLRKLLRDLSGGVWSFDDHIAFAAGSDVDAMSHIIDAIAPKHGISLFPGDWFGFLVGASQSGKIRWDRRSQDSMACLCLPSVRNGHVTEQMTDFLTSASTCLLNLNLFPTLCGNERISLARAILPVFHKSIISVSFSRGFGLTASQLGIVLMPKDHPYRGQLQKQFDWFTYFHNAIAARAFMAIDVSELQRVDQLRRQWVADWLVSQHLPAIPTGTYYVKSFYPDAPVPQYLHPLKRDGFLRLCFKPPIYS